MSPSGKALVFGTSIRGFESLHPSQENDLDRGLFLCSENDTTYGKVGHRMKKNISSRGFTIVELLIVIVVIGILAAIVIVSYTGITQRAHQSVLQQDLSDASGQLELDNSKNGVYPSTVSAANGGAGLKASTGTTYEYTYTSGSNSYCLTATNNGVRYYMSNTVNAPTEGACPGHGVVIADGVLIQNITSANCPSTRTRAVDARDNHTYWVQKLADGKCWMLTNLAYAGGGTNTFSDTKALVNTTSANFTSAHYLIPSGANVTTEPTAPSTSTNGTGQYGYLYNWCGAMGGQSTAACANATTPAPDTTVSVCPAGWRLPSGNGGEFAALNTAINSSSTATDTGFRTTWLAQYAGDWWSNAGISGYYWSSTHFPSTSAYRFYVNGSDVRPADAYYKDSAHSIRCLAN